ncbi:MAG: AAA family ATPase [Chloroflexota bacterium]
MIDRLGPLGAKLWSAAEREAASAGRTEVGAADLLLAYVRAAAPTWVFGPTDRLIESLSASAAAAGTTAAAPTDLLKRAATQANLMFSPKIEEVHLLLAALDGSEPSVEQALRAAGIERERLRQQIIRPARSHVAGASGECGALAQYGHNLVQEAVSDPIWWRDAEIEMVMEILARRQRSNPLLVGEPGLGRRVVVEGLARRLATGMVPEKLRDHVIFEIHLPAVIAGASVRGEFERRLLAIINEAQASRKIILFVDGLQGLLGGSAGEFGGAGSIVGPALLDGSIRCICAATPNEYTHTLSEDTIFHEVFQPIHLTFPSPEESVRIVNSAKGLYEAYHNVRISEDLIRRAVELTQQYQRDEHLPDKAFDLIDSTAARVSLLTRNAETQVSLTEDDLLAVLSMRTKIPLSRLTSGTLKSLLKLEERLSARVMGQDEAVSRIADIIRLTKSHLDVKPTRPDGVFLFVGPTGVGKTEMARAMADALFSDESKLIRLDMSEYMEAHSVAKLIGAPPGYVGSDQEGRLTGRVRQDPYCLILLDEVEKAHPDVLNIFLQVFEDGRLTDSQGRTVYFSNATIVMTSNLGASASPDKKELGFGQKTEREREEEQRRSYMAAIRGFFRPEFINRIDEIIFFRSLSPKDIHAIALAKLTEIGQRLREQGSEVTFAPGVAEALAADGYSAEFGARYLNRTLETRVLKPLSRLFLSHEGPGKFEVAVVDGEIVVRPAPAN